ncbi:MAG: hypothetical protein ACRC7N_08260 [Clostridium sp.]
MSHRHYKNNPTPDEASKSTDDTLQFEEFEFSYAPYNRMPPFGGPNFPQGGGPFPPNFNGGPKFPGQGGYQGGGPNQNMMGPPPSYIPTKNDKSVQKLNYNPYNQEGPQTKAVSPNSIRFCLYKYTYIWEMNGRSYWAYLFNVDRVSVSGMRWMGYYWVYFGIDLRRIDSFVCYRDDCPSCGKGSSLRESPDLVTTIKKEHTRKGTKTIISHVLSSIDIPEYKNDLITEKVGFIDDRDVETQLPCFKYRNNNYRLVLDLSLNDSLSAELKNKIISISKECALHSLNIISSNSRSDTCSILENFESCKLNIDTTLTSFENMFSDKVRELPNWKNIFDEIDYSIKEENIIGNWTTI